MTSMHSEPFPIAKEINHGYVLAPKLFSKMSSAMLTDGFLDCDDSFSIRYRCADKLVNLMIRLQAKPKVKTNVLDELLYADDTAIACLHR